MKKTTLYSFALVVSLACSTTNEAHAVYKLALLNPVESSPCEGKMESECNGSCTAKDGQSGTCKPSYCTGGQGDCSSGKYLGCFCIVDQCAGKEESVCNGSCTAENGQSGTCKPSYCTDGQGDCSSGKYLGCFCVDN